MKRSIFSPDIRLESISDLDISTVKSYQVKTLLIDIDNTIVANGQEHVSQEVLDWIVRFSKDFELILISNNPSHRTQRIADELSLKVLNFAFKPFKFKYLWWSRNQKISKQVMMIGDQIFTDVLFAKNISAISVLVKPLSTNDHFTTRILRKIENLILNDASNKS